MDPNSPPPSVDLLVSGAGISGLIAGIKAQQLGLSSIIVEKQKRFVETLKGEYIQPVGMRILQEMGISDEIKAHGLEVNCISHHYWSLPIRLSKKKLDFIYPLEDENPDYAVALGHNDLKNVLVNIYQKLGGVLLMDAHIQNYSELLGEGLRINVVQNQVCSTFTTKHLAISEGVNSAFSKKHPTEWHESPHPTSFMVGTLVENSTIPPGTFVSAQSKEGLICGFSISDTLARIYYYKDMNAGDENPFKGRRPESFLSRSIQTSTISYMFDEATFDPRVMAAPYIPKYARTPSLQHVTLIGDAAGASHPLGGHGMSTAANDGALLSKLLFDYLSGGISLNEMNSRFNEQRLERYLTTKFISESMSFIFGGQSKKARSIRQLAFRIWNNSPMTRNFCAKLFGGMLTETLSLRNFAKIWGLDIALPEVDPLSTDIPKTFYSARSLVKSMNRL